MDKKPNTLQEAIIYFSNFETCKSFITVLRWPDGIIRCPHCGSEKLSWLEKPRVWKCYSGHDKAKFSLKTGTIFEDSPLALEKWLVAVWLIVNCKNGISSYEVARDLGVSQKSAWHMMHRIRFALHNGSFEEQFSGECEADETFIGGNARNMHADKHAQRITGTGGKDKVVVMGVLERGGEVRASVVSSRSERELKGMVRKHVQAGAALYTDAFRSYHGLNADYQHEVIDHAVKYVDGRIHTNGIENFWSLLKRGLAGTYVSVEPFHLFRYLDEQCFRFNNRKEMDDFGRFTLALSQVVGKRLTWNKLTGQSQEDRPPLLN